MGEILHDEGISREKIKAWIKAGCLLRNGLPCSKPNTLLEGGEALELQGEAPASSIVPEKGALALMYEDADCLVLNKPAGLTVHPAPGLEAGTLAHRLVHRYPELAELDPQRPGIVHRIDKDTSGLLLVARNERTRLALAKAFAVRSIEKEYLALVAGVPDPPSGDIRAPIGRHPTQKVKMAVVAKGGRSAHSQYRVLHAAEDRSWSLLAVRIHTGRTHQIRVHLQHIGHPILGDRVYGPGQAACPAACRPEMLDKLASRQLLHAWRLRFEHPHSGEKLGFSCPPPPDFLRVALYLSRRVQRVAVTGLPGCGKSTVARLLERENIPLFSADAEVAALYEPGRDGWLFIKNRFGEAFLHETPGLPPEKCPVDKRCLFSELKKNEQLRREVESAVHPMVRHRLELFWGRHRRQRVALAEIPLLLEAGASWRDKAVDIVAGVYCPATLRLERLRSTRHWDVETLATMDSWQWPEATKLNACDLIIDNSKDLAALERHTQGVLRVLRWLRVGRMRRLAAALRGLWENGG